MKLSPKNIFRAASVFALLSLSACPGSVIQTQPTVAVQDILCLISTFSTEVQAGTLWEQAILDSASKCNVAQDIATQVLGAHMAAAEREGRPYTDAGTLVDAGAPAVTFPKKGQ
jgi:hypothetical protein